MARLVTTLSLNTDGLQPMFKCFSSLAEAAAEAGRCVEDIDFAIASEGLFFRGDQISVTSYSAVIDGIVYAKASPTFRMPLFAAAASKALPGVAVIWNGPWPTFRLGDDRDDDTIPEPRVGELA